MVKRIHVNQQVIRHNKKYGQTFQPLRVEEGRTTTYCREVSILGPSKLVYRRDNPLPCGAQIWIETEAPIEMDDACEYSKLSKEMKNVLYGPFGEKST